jgi:RNA polymerase sigma factor (sigma-70 family)
MPVTTATATATAPVTAGRPIPFNRFLEAYRDDVMRFLVSAVGRTDADDCFQETFMSALKAYPRLRPDSNLRAWVLTIANRKALDVHRARARRAIPVESIEETVGVAPPAQADDGLWQLVRALPPGQRAAVLLRYAGDLTHSEIATALECTEEAARRRLADALKTLRLEVTP